MRAVDVHIVCLFRPISGVNAVAQSHRRILRIQSDFWPQYYWCLRPRPFNVIRAWICVLCCSQLIFFSEKPAGLPHFLHSRFDAPSGKHFIYLINLSGGGGGGGRQKKYCMNYFMFNKYLLEHVLKAGRCSLITHGHPTGTIKTWRDCQAYTHISVAFLDIIWEENLNFWLR